MYRWYRNAIRNPQYRWWIVLGSLIYLISPIDIAPDLIPLIGQIDDVVLITILVSEISQWLMEAVTKRTAATQSFETVAEADPDPTRTTGRSAASQNVKETIDVQATSVDS